MRCAAHRFIQKELPEEAQAQCYFFNSFFYKKLTEKSNTAGKAAEGQPALSAAQRAFERVKKWTKARSDVCNGLCVHVLSLCHVHALKLGPVLLDPGDESRWWAFASHITVYTVLKIPGSRSAR